MGFQDEWNFLKYCFARRKDSRFVRNVMTVSNDPTLVSMLEMGGQETQNIFYYIKLEPSYSGFFADHNRVLSLLYYADYYGLKPVIEYGEKYSYREEHPVNGTTNPFEYYFDQPCGVKPEELSKYRSVVLYRKENAALAGQLNKKPGSGGYGMTEEYITALGEIRQKYIRLNKVTSAYVEEEIQRLGQGRRILGVHVRGTDFRENYNGHPVYILPEEYLKAAEVLLEKGKYEKIFLATDDCATLQMFQKEFHEKLVFYDDVIRGRGKETVMKNRSIRENHHYLLGLEVLRDMMTLAACDGLVAGLSQVSYSARIQKKSYGAEYEDMIILEKGINSHRSNCPI